MFWPGELLFEQKSHGRDLLGARIQALDYTHGLTDTEMPKRILSCDFKTWELLDLSTDQITAFTLEELPKHIDLFGFVLGRQTRVYKDQDPVNIKASELVGVLHDQLLASGYRGHKLEVFLTRIVFCLFADDMGIFEPRDILWDFLETRTAPDGSDLGMKLAKLSEVLNTPESDRQTALDPDLARFPYVNGHLFAKIFPTPDFDTHMRAALLNACRFDWTPISPAIFGSLFQSVMDAGERRRAGAHYTTEKNILKLIGPLFMDDLHAEFAALKARRSGRDAALRKFHDKLASLTFFDPACGAGNFLIIAYREVRKLEHQLIMELYGAQFKRDNYSSSDYVFNFASLCKVDVDQFYGIEISEFPARIAESAMWMMDHLMNRELSDMIFNPYVRIPLRKSPTIYHGDALNVDWATILPPARCAYVLGNPPFRGAKFQSENQRKQVRELANLGKSGGTLDYVCAWFIKAGAYIQDHTRIAFVSTNSITQGEQAAQLWPLLFDHYHLEIAFAHRTFEWGSDARGKAHVHVVILGLAREVGAERRLFSYPTVKAEPVETRHKAISPYLFDAGALSNPQMVVLRTDQTINGLPDVRFGSQPIDGGFYLFDESEKEVFLAVEPNAEQLFRPFVGSREYINGEKRWVLYLADAKPKEIRNLRKVKERIASVRKFRLQSKRPVTNDLAKTPTLFAFSTVPKANFLVIPEVSSERREYVPIGWLSAPTIPSNLVRVVENATLTDFALLTSTMHMSWLRHIGGRLEPRYRYSIGLVYNTFPLPPTANLSKLDPLAQAILDARAAHPSATLADLYDPDLMPPNLRAAHTALDRAVDKLYRPAGFAIDRERVEHLFALYEQMQAPRLAKPKGRRAKPLKAASISSKP